MNLEIREDVNGEVGILYRGASRMTYRDVRVERAAVLKIFEPVTSADTATEKPAETAGSPNDTAVSTKADLTHEHFERWNSFRDQPWSPPETLVAAIDKLDRDDPIIWINAAVDLMAFGLEPLPADGIERGARRQQASRALCEGARLGKFILIGGIEGDEIKRSYFDFPRKLGSLKNSLEIDHAKLADDNDFDEPFERWDRVRIDPAARFIEWLGERGGFALGKQSSLSSPPQDSVPQDVEPPERPSGPGRKKGQGSFEQLDRALFPKMEALIFAGDAVSPEGAARLIASEVRGAGTEDSRVERLAKRFRAAHTV
jgi:hypothetical protein